MNFWRLTLRVIAVFWWIQLAGAELNIICTADLHGHFERFPYLAGIIRMYGNNALRIDAGDTLTGTYYSDLNAGKPMIRLLNDLKFDVWVPGNHDFETGYSALKQRTGEFRGTVLGAQWHWREIVPAKWKLFERNGVRAAVIGLTDPAMFRRSLPGYDAVFADGIKTLENLMPEILAANPDVIIAVYHNGLYSRYGSVFQLCRHFPEIDVIAGGHSHQEIPGRKLRNAWFVQPGAHGSCVVHIKVDLDDRSRKIRRIESQIIYPDDHKADPQMLMLCRSWEDSQKKLLSSPLRKTPLTIRRDILGRYCAGVLQKVSGAEAGLMIIAGSSQRKRGKRPVPEQFAVLGNIGDLYKMFPFNNRICVVEIERQDLPELELNIRENIKKRKVQYLFSGDLRMDENQQIVMAKERITLAVNDFILTSTPVLQRKLSVPGAWRLVPDVRERDVIADFLRRFDGQ